MKRLLPMVVLLAGCPPSVDIQEPAPGSMFNAGDPIPLAVLTDASELQVDLGQAAYRNSFVVDDARHEASLPPADGLGVIVVSPNGREDQAATRAFLQGRFRDPQEIQTRVVNAWLNPDILDNGPESVAGLLSDMLMEVGLQRYIESPIVLPIPVGTLSLDVPEVEHGPIAISLFVDEARRLRLRAEISSVVMTYTAEHDTMPWTVNYGDPANPDYGVGTLDQVTVVGSVNLDFLGCRPGTSCSRSEVLRDVEVRHSGLRVDDDNCVVMGLVDVCGTVEDWMESSIDAPLAAAAAAATEHALTHLVGSLEPEIDIAFPNPIEKTLELGRAVTRADSVVLEYDGWIRAEEPVVAVPGQGALHRPDEVERGRGICLGESFVNAISFAAWDAGNLTDLQYEPRMLHAWGLPEEFPWTSVTGASVSALLPPVLEVRGGRVWVDVGGVVGVVDAGDFGEAVVRGSSSVPVEIVRTDDGVRLTVHDTGREIQSLGLGFDEAHDLLDRSRAAEIIDVLVPVMLERLFEQMSNLKLPELGVPPLDPSLGTRVQADIDLDLNGVEVVGNGWCVPATMIR